MSIKEKLDLLDTQIQEKDELLKTLNKEKQQYLDNYAEFHKGDLILVCNDKIGDAGFLNSQDGFYIDYIDSYRLDADNETINYFVSSKGEYPIKYYHKIDKNATIILLKKNEISTDNCDKSFYEKLKEHITKILFH